MLLPSVTYNSATHSDRAALGYAKAIKNYTLKEFDIAKDFFTETQIKEIANRLNVNPRDLINTQSDIYLGRYADTNLGEEDTLVALKKEPLLMRTPIMLYHDSAQFINSQYDLISQPADTNTITSSHSNKEEKSSDY